MFKVETTKNKAAVTKITTLFIKGSPTLQQEIRSIVTELDKSATQNVKAIPEHCQEKDDILFEIY